MYASGSVGQTLTHFEGRPRRGSPTRTTSLGVHDRRISSTVRVKLDQRNADDVTVDIVDGTGKLAAIEAPDVQPVIQDGLDTPG